MPVYKIRIERVVGLPLKAANFWLEADNIIEASRLFMTAIADPLGILSNEVVQLTEVEAKEQEDSGFMTPACAMGHPTRTSDGSHMHIEDFKQHTGNPRQYR